VDSTPPGTLARQLVWTLAFAIATVGCGAAETAEPEAPAPQPIGVRRMAVVQTELVVPVFGTGTIVAHKSTKIGPRVDGIIDEIFVKVGDRVRSGAPLFRTRQVHYQIRVDEASQSLQLAKAELQHAKRERDRIEILHDKGVASEARLDDVKTDYDLAAARLGKARSAHARARQELDDTTVRAPYPGAITHRYVDEGAMMRTMLSANTPVVQIMKIDIVAAIIQIPEVHLSEAQVGTPGRVKVDGIDRVFESAVYVLNDRVDPVSRAFEVRLLIANEDLEIKPGLFAQVELLPEPRLITVVDRGAVLGAEGSRYVFLEEGGTARRRPVKARDLDAMRFEVLEGLSAGEYVLSGPNLRRLSPGSPVAVEADRANR
jgi:RND family efflux transporter MFP subunit